MRILLTLLLLGTTAVAQCGKERWPIKTLADGASISATQLTTITKLVSIPAPPSKAVHRAGHTRFPAETIAYTVNAVIIGLKLEKDSDIHLVIAEPDNEHTTMIAELPSPHCTTDAKLRVQWTALRLKLESETGRARAWRKLSVPIPITITGVGFFDFAHHQTGKAPNSFELHPVTEIEFVK